MILSLKNAFLRKRVLQEEIAIADTKYRRESQVRQNEMKSLNRIIDLRKDGYDTEMVQLAETVLSIRGEFTGAGDQNGVVKDAIQEIARGGGGLFHEYMGTKNYDRFYDQRSDHTYGYGPNHGSIVFAIGLNRKAIDKGELSESEVDAALYYLLNIKEIQETERTQ